MDDDSATALLCSRLLQKAGYATIIAHDAGQAVLNAHRDQPTLVVTDLRMPAGGGVSVLERLALSSKTFHDPHPRRDGQCRRGAGTPGIEAGALRVLKKPINPTSLLEAVREAIGGPF